MAGFDVGIINIIADNLRDRYKSGFPVLKEIIQNADDAAASAGRNVQLDFGFTKGLHGTEHPLLQGPALFFLNNGSFTEQDAKAVRSFGLNSKAADSGAIGKFGLGMKSVFHLCEAFFWFAEDGDLHKKEILNPWYGNQDSPQVMWDNEWDKSFAKDTEIIKDHLKDILKEINKKQQSYFLLWIPLRQKEQLIINGQAIGSIISEFPGDDFHQLSFLFEGELKRKFSELLPLLRHLTQIRYWEVDKKDTLKPKHTVMLQEGATRNTYPYTREILPMSGKVNYSSDDTDKQSHSLIYAGFECRASELKLKELRDSKYWPTSYVRDENGIVDQQPDKAKGHCAVTFSKASEKTRGTLNINWAVFLPMGESSQERHICRSEFTYTLTLHGFFFVDAGRVAIEALGTQEKDIVFPPQSESDLRICWNYLLLTNGTFLLLIPALEKFVESANLPSGEIDAICGSLSRSNVFLRNRRHICKDHQWVYKVQQEGSIWLKINADQKILPLPAPPQKKPGRPWETFPGLYDFEKQYTFVQKNADHLTLSVSQWNEEVLAHMLSLDAGVLFSSQGLINYFILFLQEDSVKLSVTNLSSLQKQLKYLIRNAFIVLGSRISQITKGMQEVVSFVSPEQRYILKSNAPSIINKLQVVDSVALVLHKDFDSISSPANGSLSVDDCMAILENLDQQLESYQSNSKKNKAEDCRKVIQEILKNLNQTARQEVLRKGKNLKIISCHDCSLNTFSSFSLAELQQYKQEQTLFLYAPGTNQTERLGLAVKLQNVLPNEKVLLLNRDMANIVFESTEQSINQCLPEACLSTLGHTCKELSDNNARAALVEAVSGVDLKNVKYEIIRGLRYLLHGDEQQFNLKSSLWVRGYQQHPVWMKLWNQLKEQTDDNVSIAHSLVEKILQKNWESLGIKQIDELGILDNIRECGVTFIEAGSLTAEERVEVLGAAKNDQELWCSLPLHETTSGDFVGISGKAYLENSCENPIELSELIDIIRLDSDSHLNSTQRSYIPVLSDEILLHNLLDLQQPHRFSCFIFNALQRIKDNVPGDLREHLHKTPWLTDKNYTPLCPADVIDLPEIEDEVCKLLAEETGAYCQPGDLALSILNAEFVEAGGLSEYYSLHSDGLEVLSLIIAESKKYHIGELKESSSYLPQLLKIFTNVPDRLHLPGWYFLSVVNDKYKDEQIVETFFSDISHSIPANTIISVLKWLAEQHSSIKDNGYVLDAFNCYLKVFMKTPECHGMLSEIKLLNREGTWCKTHTLCADVSEIDDCHLLDIDQYKILGALISKGSEKREIMGGGSDDNRLGRDIENRSKKAAAILEEYFQDWEELVNSEAIAAFLHIMGSDENVKKVAKSYSGTRSRDWFLQEIFSEQSKTYKGKLSDGRTRVCQTSHPDQYRFVVDVITEKVTTVVSILGQNIQVGVTNDCDVITIGDIKKILYPQNDIYYILIQLRSVTPEKFSDSQLGFILKNTIVYLLQKTYFNNGAGLDRLWEGINKSEQIDIRVAHSLVMDNLPLYLDQLGVQRKHPVLKQIHREWDNARHRDKEPTHDSKIKMKNREKLKESLFRLQDVVSNNTEVQAVVLQAVKRKIADSMYTSSSVPFELFQNADDAVVELAEIRDYSNRGFEDTLPEQSKKVIVEKLPERIQFLHWGRPINYLGSGGFPGRDKGYHQDLEKMLIISSSNKSGSDNTTGKFGLGFKSTLLISDTPIIVSGRLSVIIKAGLCPVVLVDSSLYRKTLKAHYDDRRLPGTMIELPLQDTGAGEITGEFELLAGITTIFSKKIRTIEFHEQSKPVRRESWEPEIFPISQEGSAIELGEFTFEENIIKACYFRSKTTGGVLVAVGPNGLKKLPDRIPAVWVVAPTREQGSLGFVINGQFDIDPGRSRLAGDMERNKQKARILGDELGNALCQLFIVSNTNFQVFVETFGLRKDLNHYDFWNSVWETFTSLWIEQSESEVIKLTKSLLTNTSRLAKLITSHPALPNGLWGSKYRTLISPNDIRFVLRDSLSTEEIFRPLSKWNLLCGKLSPSSVISQKILSPALGKILPGFAQKKDQWQSLRLAQVIGWLEEENYHVDSKTADILGAIVTKEFLAKLLGTKEGEAELLAIKGQLHKLRFLAQDKKWYESNHLLRTQPINVADDEPNRSAFAPPENKLDESYTSAAVDFFIVCRMELKANADTMVKWILSATNDLKKEAALRYLISGDLGPQVTFALHKLDIEQSWLLDLSLDSFYFEGWNADDVKQLLYRMLPSIADLEKGHIQDDYYAQHTKVIPPPDVKKTLENIYSWWIENEREYLSKYETRTYPVSFVATDLDDDERPAWLTLLMLGAFHTFGRAKPEQHRNFLTMCQEKGWWKIFTQENPKEQPDKWMGILEDYIDNQVADSKFEYWMRLFPTIYKFARDIEEYIEIFYSLETQGNNVDVEQTMAPKTFADFQGGGFVAAPIARTLGMGVPFVLREMVRKNLFVQNQINIKPYCFVPMGRVRNLFSKMNCPDLENGESHLTKSEIIYDFLCEHLGTEKADLRNGFDIPFQFIADDLSLQERLFV